MIGLEDRRHMAQIIDEAHANGARLSKACQLAGIHVRTLQRWKIQDGLEDREQQAFRQDALEFHCLFVNSHNRFNRKKPVIQFRRG